MSLHVKLSVPSFPDHVPLVSWGGGGLLRPPSRHISTYCIGLRGVQCRVLRLGEEAQGACSLFLSNLLEPLDPEQPSGCSAHTEGPCMGPTPTPTLRISSSLMNMLVFMAIHLVLEFRYSQVYLLASALPPRSGSQGQAEHPPGHSL